MMPPALRADQWESTPHTIVRSDSEIDREPLGVRAVLAVADDEPGGIGPMGRNASDRGEKVGVSLLLDQAPDEDEQRAVGPPESLA